MEDGMPAELIGLCLAVFGTFFSIGFIFSMARQTWSKRH